MSTLKATENMSPVYIPWKSFENYIAGLKNTTVPHTLDGSVKPKSMSGGLWRQIISALRFIGVITPDNVVTEGLESLVAAHGTDQWPQVVKEHILPAYEAIINDLPIDNATAGQLNARFKDGASVDGQMLGKCVRFYIHALDQAGVKYSSHFAMREGSANGTTRAKTKRKKPNSPVKATTKDKSGDDDSSSKENAYTQPKGTRRYPLYFKGKPEGSLVVPDDLTAADCKLIEKQLEVLREYAGNETE